MQLRGKRTIQCNFKVNRQSNAFSKEDSNPMQFQSKRTIQSNLKVSRQSNAIFKASRQSNASSNFKSSGLCVWALVAGQTRCVICLKHVDTRLNHNKYILFYHHKLYNKQCQKKDEPQKYHNMYVCMYVCAITICTKCNV